MKLLDIEKIKKDERYVVHENYAIYSNHEKIMGTMEYPRKGTVAFELDFNRPFSSIDDSIVEIVKCVFSGKHSSEFSYKMRESLLNDFENVFSYDKHTTNVIYSSFNEYDISNPRSSVIVEQTGMEYLATTHDKFMIYSNNDFVGYFSDISSGVNKDFNYLSGIYVREKTTGERFKYFKARAITDLEKQNSKIPLFEYDDANYPRNRLDFIKNLGSCGNALVPASAKEKVFSDISTVGEKLLIHYSSSEMSLAVGDIVADLDEYIGFVSDVFNNGAVKIVYAEQREYMRSDIKLFFTLRFLEKTAEFNDDGILFYGADRRSNGYISAYRGIRVSESKGYYAVTVDKSRDQVYCFREDELFRVNKKIFDHDMYKTMIKMLEHTWFMRDYVKPIFYFCMLKAKRSSEADYFDFMSTAFELASNDKSKFERFLLDMALSFAK